MGFRLEATAVFVTMLLHIKDVKSKKMLHLVLSWQNKPDASFMKKENLNYTLWERLNLNLQILRKIERKQDSRLDINDFR